MTDIPREITPELLLRAYASGIFPMAEGHDNPEIFWVDPHHRGILPLDGFHISRSLARRMRKGDYTASWNADFSGVLEGCADRSQTWINDEIRVLYTALHSMGHAHSLEISADGRLVGGVYGVALGSAFFGESMFSHQTDASKLALAHLCDHLRRCCYTLFDTQFLTDHLASLGAVEISRDKYRGLLARALGQSAVLGSVEFAPDSEAVLQRMTQTS